MTANDVTELERVFAELNKSGDGVLSKKDLLDGYRKYYGADFNETEVEALLNMADQNSDGGISYSEFIMTSVNREKFLTMEKLENIFNEIDADRNHMLSFEELNSFLGRSEHLPTEELMQAF